MAYGFLFILGIVVGGLALLAISKIFIYAVRYTWNYSLWIMILVVFGGWIFISEMADAERQEARQAQKEARAYKYTMPATQEEIRQYNYQEAARAAGAAEAALQAQEQANGF